MDLKRINITLAYSCNWQIIKCLKFQYLIMSIYKNRDTTTLAWFFFLKTKDDNIIYKPAWHWGNAGRVPGRGSTGPPSAPRLVLCGPLGEVLSHPAGSSKQVQNVGRICLELPNLEQQEKLFKTITIFTIMHEPLILSKSCGIAL